MTHLDEYIEKEYQERKQYHDRIKHKWHSYNNCKHEADRLREDAKKRRDEESGNFDNTGSDGTGDNDSDDDDL